MKSCLVVAAALIISFSSCDYIGRERIRGNGEIKSEIREEKGFQSIDISGAIKVFIKQDSAYSVRVEADANILEHVETYMQKNTLIIKPESGYNFRPTRSIKVYVSGPSFRYIEVSGASSVESENRISSADEFFINLSGASEAVLSVKSPSVGVETTGASTATLSGETRELSINGSGASNAKCFDLLTENAHVDISGASNAQVFASVKLDAHASGASDVRYKGNAAVTQDVSGAGSVKKVE